MSHFVLPFCTKPPPCLPRAVRSLWHSWFCSLFRTRGLALLCVQICPRPGPSGTSALVFLQEAAAGKCEARGQWERKEAHQPSQPSPALSPLISQLWNISAGGCHLPLLDWEGGWSCRCQGTRDATVLLPSLGNPDRHWCSHCCCLCPSCLKLPTSLIRRELGCAFRSPGKARPQFCPAKAGRSLSAPLVKISCIMHKNTQLLG